MMLADCTLSVQQLQQHDGDQLISHSSEHHSVAWTTDDRKRGNSSYSETSQRHHETTFCPEDSTALLV